MSRRNCDTLRCSRGGGVGDRALISQPRNTIVVGTPGPEIVSVTPATSPVTGGVSITIAGNLFQPGAAVEIGGVPVPGAFVASSTTITATTPPGPVGPAAVKVTNPDMLSSVLPGGITYVPELVVSSIAPLVPLPGATVAISGAGFVPGLELTVAGTGVAPQSVSANEVTFVNPPALPCDAEVTVTNPDLQTDGIVFNPSPSIQQVVNNQGSAAGGGLFFILGDFVPGCTVTVGGNGATIVDESQIALLVEAPPGTPGLQPVVVTTANGCAATTEYFYSP